MTPEESLQLAELVDADDDELRWAWMLTNDLVDLRAVVKEFKMMRVYFGRNGAPDGVREGTNYLIGKMFLYRDVLTSLGIDFSAEVAALVAT